MRHIFPLILIVIASGCEEPTHPARVTADNVLQSLQYGDFEMVASQHVDATTHGPYCADAFTRVLDKVKKEKSPELCNSPFDEVDPGTLDDKSRLLLQMMEYVCMTDTPSCEDYGKRTLVYAMKESEDLSGLTGTVVQRMLGDETSAVVYADLKRGDAVVHRTLKFKKVGPSWILESGLLQ